MIWFENRRVKRVKSRNKENLPYDNCNFTMKKLINCGTTTVTKYEFAEFIASINESHEGDNKCGSYLLLNNLNPSQPREAQRYLDALIHDQNSESNWSWGLAAAATVGPTTSYSRCFDHELTRPNNAELLLVDLDLNCSVINSFHIYCPSRGSH